MLRSVLSLLSALALVYALGVLAAYWGQRSLMYPAPGVVKQPDPRAGELLELESEAGRVYCLYRGAQNGQPTVVHFHGNGEQLADTEFLVTELAAEGIGVLSVEYPGYGLATAASLNERNVYLTAEVAVNHLSNELGVPSEQILLQGQSLGTGVAVELARRGHGAGLILISPYTSMLELAKGLMPFLPVGLLLKDRYESDVKAPGISLPTLILHGTRDELVPVRMGEKLATLLPRAQLQRIEGAGHNDLFVRHAPEMLSAIRAFASSF